MEADASSAQSKSQSPAARRLALAARLRPDRWQRAEDLARAFDVSVRTIYRDVETLVEAGVEVVAVPGKGYRLKDDAPGKAFAAQQSAAASEAPHQEAPPGPLRRAVAERRALQFRNGPPGSAQAAPRRLDPYALTRRGGRWVLVGYDHREERVRRVWLDATADWQPLPEVSFVRPVGYGEEEESFPRDQTVRVRFAPQAARQVRRTPPVHTERVEEQGEAVILTLRVHRLADVISWVLSWGAQARVLSPQALRRRIAEEARHLTAHYREAPALID
jgi:predicted DNA-binding transcriptional regulator YafY